MSANDAILMRLNEIVRNPHDPALDICFSPRAAKQAHDFCRNLGVLLNALSAYNADPPNDK